VLLFGLLYTQDVKTGLSVLETSFSFVGVAMILNSLGNFGMAALIDVLSSFVLGVLCACAICLVHAMISYIQLGNPNVFFFYELTGIIDSHPTYLAYYLIAAITFCLYLLNLQSGHRHPFLISVTILFFFVMLILTGGQTSFVSVLLVFSFFILQFILEKKTKARRMVFILVAAMVGLMFVYSSTSLNEQEKKLNDSWDRMVVWQSALKANSNILLGMGTGDYKLVLNDYYRSHGLESYAKINFNSHNQLVQTLLTNGLIGLIAIVLLIGRPLYLAFKQDDAFGVLMFFPFIIYGMTEVFLGRYQGVVFFSLLHQLFVSYYSQMKSSLPLRSE
jgi:O-antigen ligase